MIRKPFILTTLLLALACGCRQQSTIPQPPTPDAIRRIVTLSPSLSEAVFALGAGDRVVGVTAFADYPPAVLELPKVGGYSEINTEAVFALKPDLVLALGQQAETIARLQALGIPTVSFDNNSLAEIIAMLENIGSLLGRENRARELLAEIETTRADIAIRTADLPKRRVLVSVGRNMGSGDIGDVYVAGRNTIYGEILALIGGESVYSGPLPYAPLGREAILRLNPEVILDLIPNLESMHGYSAEDAIAQWQVFDALDAVRFNHITICTANYICVPGPRIAMMMRDLAKAIHPNLETKP